MTTDLPPARRPFTTQVYEWFRSQGNRWVTIPEIAVGVGIGIEQVKNVLQNMGCYSFGGYERRPVPGQRFREWRCQEPLRPPVPAATEPGGAEVPPEAGEGEKAS